MTDFFSVVWGTFYYIFRFFSRYQPAVVLTTDKTTFFLPLDVDLSTMGGVSSVWGVFCGVVANSAFAVAIRHRS